MQQKKTQGRIIKEGKGYIKTEILDCVDGFTFNPISAKYGCNFKHRILPVMKITTAVISHQCLIKLIYDSHRELSLQLVVNMTKSQMRKIPHK